MITLLTGDCRDQLATLPDQSVQCIVTSPPYYGLRKYTSDPREIGQEAIPDCRARRRIIGVAETTDEDGVTYFIPTYGPIAPCGACYVCSLVAVFAACWRVLRDDGTLWVNLGDSYAGSGKGIGSDHGKAVFTDSDITKSDWDAIGIPPKNLLGMPWRVAFALQDDGWILRSDIIWSKPNPMPESVRDRPTRAHEYMFLFAKRQRYFYDATAIAEQASSGEKFHGAYAAGGRTQATNGRDRDDNQTTTRNRRSVWTIATQPSRQQVHFATMPEALVEPCVLAGSSSMACETCGAAWVRVVERTEPSYWEQRKQADYTNRKTNAAPNDNYKSISKGKPENSGVGYNHSVTTGFAPACRCEVNTGSARSIVLDPFGGAGTVAKVAERFQRDSIMIDLNPAYVELQEERVNGVQVDMLL